MYSRVPSTDSVNAVTWPVGFTEPSTISWLAPWLRSMAYTSVEMLPIYATPLVSAEKSTTSDVSVLAPSRRKLATSTGAVLILVVSIEYKPADWLSRKYSVAAASSNAQPTMTQVTPPVGAMSDATGSATGFGRLKLTMEPDVEIL